MQEHQLIKACLRGEASAYEKLYYTYAPKMVVVCRRYVGNHEDIDDLIQIGFMKVFQELHRFRNEGSLEGWIRRIMVNLCLDHYKKTVKPQQQVVDISQTQEQLHLSSEQDIVSMLSAEELLHLIETLPPTYRLVFNLYVFEGYKHHEIADQLGIAEGTSKSNLRDARQILQKKIVRMNKEAKPRSI